MTKSGLTNVSYHRSLKNGKFKIRNITFFLITQGILSVTLHMFTRKGHS